MRIIKDAKISRDPVVIAMHNFTDLAATELFADAVSEDDECQIVNEATLSCDAEKVSNGILKKTLAPSAEVILNDAVSQANAIKASAEEDVARMKTQALEEAAGLKVQALEAGKAQGEEEAQRQIADKLQQTTNQCNALMAAAVQESQRIILEADSQIIDLVMAISRKVLFDAMEDRPELIVGIVKSALERVKDQSQINIHVSLDDYERVLQSRRELQGIVGADRVIAVTADSMLGAGGCLIETSFGTVEAGVDTQLDSIRKVLQELLP
jgi:flagellar assembly protein FliH